MTTWTSRQRRWIAGLLAALVAAVSAPTPLDLDVFAGLGRSVLAGRFAEAYAGTFTQAGPLQLILSRVLAIGAHDGVPHVVTRVLVAVALVLGAMAACRGRASREIAAATLTLLWMTGPLPWHGHPAEAAIPMLWAYAMVLHRRGHRLAAAGALAASALIAPVAVLGFPCLLAVTGPVRAARTTLLAAAIVVAGFLPFVLSGAFDMFRHVWPVTPGTVPALLGLHEAT
ncbi:hypothetical protein, partial [Actinoplanes philippinensis]|uniref:hypothetical protein n=1 Tax=Actinoplanes philippinensis TaxID=35752 RepID=UPI00340BCF8C